MCEARPGLLQGGFPMCDLHSNETGTCRALDVIFHPVLILSRKDPGLSSFLGGGGRPSLSLLLIGLAEGYSIVFNIQHDVLYLADSFRLAGSDFKGRPNSD